MLKILVLGATSAIAHETMRCFARDGAEFFLVARHTDKLAAIEKDLLAQGAKRVLTAIADLNDVSGHADLLNHAHEALNGVDALFMAYGTLGDQAASQASVEVTLQELHTNALSSIAFLTIAANYFERQRRGVIAVITSVAGDRGRASNAIYGTAMAAKSTFLSGLRNRLAKSGVHVLTIKPGQVDTPMTAHMRKGVIWAQPADVGKDIYKAMKNRRDVLYTPWFWRWIMVIIRLLPEPIFKKLNL